MTPGYAGSIFAMVDAGRSRSFVSSPNEEAVYPLVSQGVFSVDEDGHVWRVGSFAAGEWGRKVIPCEPRRAEKRMPHGYLIVRSSIRRTVYHVGAHRLVWRHFMGPIPAGRIINHKNGVKSDNRPENLELTDHAGNDRHARDVLRFDNRGEKNCRAVLTNLVVLEIRKAAAAGLTFDQLVERFHHSRSNIHRVVTRQTWKSVP